MSAAPDASASPGGRRRGGHRRARGALGAILIGGEWKPPSGLPWWCASFKLMRGDFITRWRERGVTSVRLRSDNGALQLGAVQPDSPGARAGAKVGNRLLSVDGRSVAGMGEGAASYLASPKPGETVTLTVETPGSEAREIRIVAEKLKR